MKSINKTKRELIDELKALRDRVSELEGKNKNPTQPLGIFAEKAGPSYAQMAYMHEAIFVIFDRKLEFINDKFSELFGVSPEEACSCYFDPMTLIAPESRRFVEEVYRAGCRGSFTARELKYTGLSKDGLEIECETFFLFIPYKWGVAIQGTLRSNSVSRHIDYSLLGRNLDLPVAVYAASTEIPYADRDHLFMQANETSGKTSNLHRGHIPHF